MSVINLTEAKLHLRVDHDEEDDAITAMIDTAELHAANYCNSPDGMLEYWGDSNGEIPAPMRSAVLLMIGNLYANREAQGERQLFANDTFYRLLDPYRQMVE